MPEWLVKKKLLGYMNVRRSANFSDGRDALTSDSFKFITHGWPEYSRVEVNYSGFYHGWSINGILEYKGEYLNGKLDGDYEFYDDSGFILISGSKVKGIKHGVYRSFYKKNKIKFIIHYSDGKYEGMFESWFENGNKKYEGLFLDGNAKGLHEEWNKDGTFNIKAYYDSKDNFRRREFYQNNKLYQIEIEEYVEGCLIISTHSSENDELIKKVYMDKYQYFQKRELFEKGKLVRTEVEE
ncbi:MAG: hypothetical protein COA79_22885 [Planctomycetota bacterium]|nr:MAG: hypothetical protein COA79_22885 [Planctomycetota bacterium]